MVRKGISCHHVREDRPGCWSGCLFLNPAWSPRVIAWISKTWIIEASYVSRKPGKTFTPGFRPRHERCRQNLFYFLTIILCVLWIPLARFISNTYISVDKPFTSIPALETSPWGHDLMTSLPFVTHIEISRNWSYGNCLPSLNAAIDKCSCVCIYSCWRNVQNFDEAFPLKENMKLLHLWLIIIRLDPHTNNLTALLFSGLAALPIHLIIVPDHEIYKFFRLPLSDDSQHCLTAILGNKADVHGR